MLSEVHSDAFPRKTICITTIHRDVRRRLPSIPLFSSSDKGVFYTSDENDKFTKLYYRAFGSESARNINADIPWNITEYTLSPDRSRRPGRSRVR